MTPKKINYIIYFLVRTRNKMFNILFLGCNYFFRKFTLLCAISNSKCVGATLYKEGGMTPKKILY